MLHMTINRILVVGLLIVLSSGREAHTAESQQDVGDILNKLVETARQRLPEGDGKEMRPKPVPERRLVVPAFTPPVLPAKISREQLSNTFWFGSNKNDFVVVWFSRDGSPHAEVYRTKDDKESNGSFQLTEGAVELEVEGGKSRYGFIDATSTNQLNHLGLPGRLPATLARGTPPSNKLPRNGKGWLARLSSK